MTELPGLAVPKSTVELLVNPEPVIVTNVPPMAGPYNGVRELTVGEP